METIRSFDLDLVADIEAIDAFASTRTLLLFQSKNWRNAFGHNSRYDLDVAATVEDYRKSLKDSLSKLLERDNGPSQRHFWHFFDNVLDASPSFEYAFLHEIFRKDLIGDGRSNSAAGGECVQPSIIDGQHQCIAYTNPTRDLSGR